MNNTSRSNPSLILWLACSTGLGVAAGLPLIYRKNGLGLLVVFVVSILAISTISTLAKRDFTASTDEPPKPKPRIRVRPFLSLASFAIVGLSVAVIGGLVTHYVSPMHPLDVFPNLTALAILGAFAGFVVGTALLFATIISYR